MRLRRPALAGALLAILLATSCGVANPGPKPLPVRTATDSRPATDDTSISVASYGASGDGVSDARPGIQAALDAAAGSGGAVHFPPGTYLLLSATQPGDRVLRTYPSQRLLGAGNLQATLRIGPAFDPYVTVLGLASDQIAAGTWSLSDLAIDQNSAEQNLLDTVYPLRHPLMALRLGSYQAGSSVTVTRCRLWNSSSLNGLYVYAQTVTVAGCIFSKIGGPFGSPVHDHSTVYTATVVAGGEQRITGNTFEGVPGSGGARSAIDTHGGRQLIQGNIVTGYLRGFNLTDLAAIPTTQLTVDANVISGALIGIEIWTRLQKRGGGIRNLVIRNQRIYVDPRPWRRTGISAPLSGIMLNRLSDGPIEGLEVAGNTIRYQDASLGGGIQSAAAIDCSVIGRAPRLTDLVLVGNHVLRPPRDAISPSCRVAGAQIRSNRVDR